MADNFQKPEGGDLSTYQNHQANQHDNMTAVREQFGNMQSHGNSNAGSNIPTGMSTRQES